MGARRPTTLCGGTGDTMSSQALLSRTLQDLVRAGARLGGDVVEHIITLRDERLGLVVSPGTYGMRTKSRIDLPTRRLELDLAAIRHPFRCSERTVCRQWFRAGTRDHRLALKGKAVYDCRTINLI
jgi:hypothetical protein